MNQIILYVKRAYPLFLHLLFLFSFASCKKTPAPTKEPEVILLLSAAPLSHNVYFNRTGEVSITVTDGATVTATANGVAVSVNNRAIVLPNLIQNTTVIITAAKAGKTASAQVEIKVFSQKMSWVSLLKTFLTKRESIVAGMVYNIPIIECVPPFKFETSGILRRFNNVCTPGMIEGVATWNFLENENKIEFGGAVPWTILEMDSLHMKLRQPDDQGNFNQNTYEFRQ